MFDDYFQIEGKSWTYERTTYHTCGIKIGKNLLGKPYTPTTKRRVVNSINRSSQLNSRTKTKLLTCTCWSNEKDIFRLENCFWVNTDQHHLKTKYTSHC